MTPWLTSPRREGRGFRWSPAGVPVSRPAARPGRLPRDRWSLGWLEGGGKQIAGRQAAVGPPFPGDGQDLLLGGQVVQLVSGPDRLAERQVARQDDVLALQREEHGALDGPRAYARNRAELAGIYREQFGGCGEVAAEQGLDPGQGPAGRRDGQLLAGNLEQQRTMQVHRRQLVHPRPGVEVRPVVDEPRQHRVGVAQVRAGLRQPLSAAGILPSRQHSFLPAGTPIIVITPVWF